MFWLILIIIAGALLVMLGRTLAFIAEFVEIDCWK